MTRIWDQRDKEQRVLKTQLYHLSNFPRLKQTQTKPLCYVLGLITEEPWYIFHSLKKIPQRNEKRFENQLKEEKTNPRTS